MKTSDLFSLGKLVYPIMLAQEAGEISEGKAVELLGLDYVSYREQKAKVIQAIVGMVESLPSPLILLLEGTKGLPKSSTKKQEKSPSHGEAEMGTGAS